MIRVVVDEAARVVRTTFEDGALLEARPVTNVENVARARSLGYGRVPAWPLTTSDADAVWAMTRDHDRLHVLLADAEGRLTSLALWFAAHPGTAMHAAHRREIRREERAVLLMQRLLNVGLDAVAAERA